jgi:hypothetical protein
MANYGFTQYVPSFIKAVGDNSKSYVLKFADLPGFDSSNENSFANDIQGSGLKSTQQLDIDWSKFENHTFFMSAEAKVNLAFELIVNGYPFDGNKEEIDSFFSNLTGFEKWVFDQIPKYRGELLFSGTQLSETTPDKGTYIVVKDIPGAMFPSLNPDALVKSSVLSPKNNKSLSVEMQLFVPTIQTLGTQIVFQKLNADNNHGISFRLNQTTSIDEVEAQFDVFSGSSAMTVSSQIKKGEFNHLCLVFDRESNNNVLKFYNNESLKATSNSVYLKELDIDYNDFIIGSGTSYKVASTIVTPQQTLSGVLDELRFFHSVRNVLQQKSYAKKSIFSTPDLKLYYRFNEPAPPLSPISGDVTNAIVLDSSGNSLHSYIRNFVDALRIDASSDTNSNMIYEKLSTCPILFPSYAGVVNLNSDLLDVATDYDAENPNLITKLIPRHYLLEGAALEGFQTALQNNGSQYSGTGIPGQGKLNNVQLLLSLLYIWAKFFDEIKLFLDAFSTIKYVSYDTRESAPDNFLFDIAKSYGFYIPGLFTDSSVEQYLQGENIDPLFKSNESLSLQQVQNSILRRILVNLPAVIRSKGTQHSIKSFLRAVGIDPDNSMRFREYGGPTYRHLSKSREFKSDVTTMVKFISSSLAVSPYLSSSRTEPGEPAIAGNFINAGSTYGIHGISDDPNDGLFTSGSWTFETSVKYGSNSSEILTSITQSIVRFCVTGSGIQNPGVVANLVTYKDEDDSRIDLFLRPGNSTSAPYLKLSLDLGGSSIFNGEVWNVSFGCIRNDQIQNSISSSYYVRAGFQNEGEIQQYYATSSYFLELAGGGSPDENVFRTINSSLNASGTFLCVGTNQTIPAGTTSTYLYLNNSSVVSDAAARVTNFDGRLSKTRFWSKSFATQEWAEHIRNYQSLGVSDPTKNYNYVYTVSGSFEKLRMDSMSKQTTRTAVGSQGLITFLDFSENNMHILGTGFPTDYESFLPEIIRYSHLSAYYDEAISNDKIRVRGYIDDALIDANPWASRAPVHQINRSESPTDDVRFSIDFSLVDSLNKDIVNMFSTFEALENAVGSPELVYSPDYPDLEKLRNIYFNRLKEKLNFKAFFEFYSWFDNSISSFIEQLMPRKTVYKGTNFIVESHMLERHKHEYYSSEIYLGENDRNRIRDNLLLQQIAGVIRRF